jgi:lipopolysaccharide biosynthesis glycosyltransferase
MNVVYSSSDLYSEIAGVSMTSLFENNKDVEEITVYVVDNGISELNRNRLLNTARKYNRKLIFVPKVDLETLAHTKVYTGRWNIGTFFRLYLSSILPQSVERVMYIDCDMIIRHSLEDVYNLDLGNCSVAGADDCRSDLYRIEIGCEPGSTYINNGFMLIDLKKWRDEGVEKDFTDFISARKGDCTYMDQAPLNGVLGPRHEIYELEPKYNAQRVFFDFTYKQLMKIRKPEHHLSEEQYKKAVDDPIIVHFTPVFISGTRPWQIKDKHKFAPEYRYYKDISEWKNEPYRKDDRKLKKKIMTILCKICPKFIMIPVMSYLHSTWYPKKRIKIAKRLMGE